MKTGHGPGKDAISLSTTLNREDGEIMDELANEGGHSRSAWARHAIRFAIRQRLIFKISVDYSPTQLGQAFDPPEKPVPQTKTSTPPNIIDPAAGGASTVPAKSLKKATGRK
ncbi:MAG: ribbon-helix-helix domain-containing protein [Terrimicrobiaceae bacterium]